MDSTTVSAVWRLLRRTLPVWLILLSGAASAVAEAADHTQQVVAEIERHAQAHDLKIGLAAIHLESGHQIMLNADDSFPLASTYKVPMAAYALHRVSEGTLSLEQLIEIEQQDLVISSTITRLFPHPGIRLSLLNLLEATLIQSDNTATDVLLRTVGGGPAVTGWLRQTGIDDLRVDRSTADLIRDYMGMPESDGETSMASQYQALNEALTFDALTESDWVEFYAALLADPRDQGTPRAMATLLRGIWQDSYLDTRYGETLRAIMARCLTGNARLSAGLPAQQLPIAHKTGTLGGTVNDVGMMQLPDGLGSVAIVVFTQGRSTLNVAAGERAIAETGRTVYDYFLFAADPFAADQ